MEVAVIWIDFPCFTLKFTDGHLSWWKQLCRVSADGANIYLTAPFLLLRRHIGAVVPSICTEFWCNDASHSASLFTTALLLRKWFTLSISDLSKVLFKFTFNLTETHLVSSSSIFKGLGLLNWSSSTIQVTLRAIIVIHYYFPTLYKSIVVEMAVHTTIIQLLQFKCWAAKQESINSCS